MLPAISLPWLTGCAEEADFDFIEAEVPDRVVAEPGGARTGGHDCAGDEGFRPTQTMTTPNQQTSTGW